MKKKLTTGEKRESRLRYLYRQLKRAGKIKKDTPLKLCRGELSLGLALQEKKPRKKRVSGKSSPPTKKFRRKARKCLKAKFRNLRNLAKKARRERRKAYVDEKHKKAKLPKVEPKEKVSRIQEKFPGRPKINVDLS